ncbi:hypothetical protein FF2_002379 [Malus domestica]
MIDDDGPENLSKSQRNTAYNGERLFDPKSSVLLISIHQLPQASSCFSVILNTIEHPAANPNDFADTGTATSLLHLLLAVEVDQVTISSAYAIRNDQPAVNSSSPNVSATSI